MAFEDILYEVEAGVATVTLNRPDRLNAWRGVMEAGLRAAMRLAADDPEVMVIVLTGAGRGVCANADMAVSLKSDDFKEGVAHFLEKRPARFTGR
jgi:enoyl-CoA hydratase/carnithine racemase